MLYEVITVLEFQDRRRSFLYQFFLRLHRIYQGKSVHERRIYKYLKAYYHYFEVTDSIINSYNFV